jgi:flagellar hook-length control protein FliK
VTQNPIAALLPAATGPASPQTTPVNANAPLAIAAAAIAATSSTTAATAPPELANTGPAPKATTATATNAKTAAQTAAIGAATTQQATDPTATADAAIAVAAGTPGATTTKTTTGFKTTQLTQGKAAAATTATGGKPGTTDPSVMATANNANSSNAAPQPAVEAKPDQAAALGDAVKPDGNNAPAASATRDHAPAAGNGQAPAAPIDPNAQLAAVPQQLSNTTQVAATDKFTVTQATGAAVPVSGLAVEIAASVHSGKTQFEVRLDPADLGRIDVRIAVDRNGQVTSHLTVEKPETLTMLQQDAPQLQQALNDAGLKTGSSGLQFSLRDQSQSGQQQNNSNQSGAQPQRLIISEDDTVPAAVAGRSYGRMLSGNGGVDIRV